MSLWTIAMLAAAQDDGCADGRVTLDGVEQPDLVSALAAAADGSWIEVCAGTYIGTFTSAVPVHLVAPEGPALTVLDGGLAGSVLTLPGGSTVAGFTVTGGSSTAGGGGLRLTSAGETLIQDCTFVGNAAPTVGGGAVAAPDGSTVRAWDSEFTGNTAATGGAFLVGNVATAVPTVPNLGVVLDLTGSVVSGNTAAGTLTPLRGGMGGGVVGYDATVIGGEVSGNQSLNRRSGFVTALGMGGGMTLFWDAASVGTTVSGNTAQGGGGGLYLVNGSTVVLDGVVVEDNEAARNGGGIAASGLTRPMQVLAHGSEIRGNHTTRDGGGVTIAGGQRTGGVTWSGGEIAQNSAASGGGLFVETGSHAVADVELVENVATWYGGGAGGRSVSPVFSFWTLSFTGCLFEGNTALYETGGGLDLGQPATISDSEFVGNVAAQGGGLSLFGWRHLSATPMAYTLSNVELKLNSATDSGGGLLVTGNAAVTATGTEVKQNVAPVAGGVNLEDGAMTSLSGDYKDGTPDDVWVAKVASGYSDLEEFVCTNTGCAAPGETARAASYLGALLVEPEREAEPEPVDDGDCYEDYGAGEPLEPC